MATFKWINKEPSLNFFGKVTSMSLALECTDGTKTVQTTGAVCFGPDNIKDKSEWTETTIDAFAEEVRERNGWDDMLIEELENA
mgnify:CR=1 FL=1